MLWIPLLQKKTELSFNKTFPNNYKRDESVVQALSPYLASNIANPGNLTHALYLKDAEDARKNLAFSKSELLALMKASKSYTERMTKFGIANEADLNSITFVHIPVYYITPNIVLFKNGENIAKYYNLAGTGLKYLAFRDQQLIGYLDFYEHKNRFKSEFIPALPPAKESYNQVVAMGKRPIALLQSIYAAEQKNVGAGGHVHMFGYMDQGHLVFSFYEQRIVQNTGTDSYVAPNPRFHKIYNLYSAESFFSGTGSRSIINQWLESTVNSLKSRL